MLRAKSKWPRGSVASQGRGRSQSHTSHSITRDGVTGKCQPTHKEEPSAHRIIRLPEGGAILHSHDSSLSTHTLFSLYFWIHFSFLVISCFHLCVCIFFCSGNRVCFLSEQCCCKCRSTCNGLATVHYFLCWPLCPWCCHRPLVWSVASDVLIYYMILSKKKKYPGTHPSIHR